MKQAQTRDRTRSLSLPATAIYVPSISCAIMVSSHAVSMSNKRNISRRKAPPRISGLARAAPVRRSHTCIRAKMSLVIVTYLNS